MDLKFKQSTVGLKTPRFENGAISIFASEDVIVAPSESKFVKTNTSFEIPEGYILIIVPESSVAEKTALRFGNSMRVVTDKEKDDVSILVENVKPSPVRKDVMPGYTTLDGNTVYNNYSKGYLPVGTIYVRKGDRIGSGYLLKVETVNVTRTTTKKG